MKLVGVATSALLLGSAACSLLVDSSGLTLSSKARGDADATNANDAAVAQDASASDAMTPDAEAGAPTRFCDAHPGALFCEDFDGLPLDTTRVSTQNGTGAATASSSAPSAPNVFVAQVGALASGEQGHAVFRLPNVTLQKFHCAFDVSMVGGTDAIVFDLEAAAGGGTMNYQSELLGDSTFAIYQEFFQGGDGGLTQPFSWNGDKTSRTLSPTWQHVDVCFDFATSARVLAFDGKKVAQGTGVPNWPETGELFFGAYVVRGPSTLQEVHIDNVLVDTAACPP